MNINITEDKWNPHFISEHPLFWPLKPFAQHFVSQFSDWPNLDHYQQYLLEGAGTIQSASGATLKFVSQGTKPDKIEQAYEPRIYLQGDIQTRLKNWHDFFQVLVWRIFPNTKISLNNLHYSAILKRLSTNKDDKIQNNNKRSALENVLTQFDECGGIILSTDASLLEKIERFQWSSLFWDHKDMLDQELKCVLFGHALYEKGLRPYIGMTAHCILLQIDKSTFSKPTTELLPIVDQLIHQKLIAGDQLNQPKDLHPFPLLGLPGWHPDNNNKEFYQNTQYFRSGRKK